LNKTNNQKSINSTSPNPSSPGGGRDFWQTFGHKTLKNILQKQLAANKVSSTYLFLGPEGVGKKTLALELAGKILGADRLDNHPDYQLFDAQGEITVEQTLEFMSRLSYKPFLAGKKVAIINNAQNLNLQSGNALLKTLEEPSPSTIIILISSQKLLPTIMSRCQVLYFNSFSFGQLAEFDKTAGQEIVSLSFGSIARLKKLREDKNYLEEEKQVISFLEDLKKKKPSARLSLVSVLAEKESQELENNFLTWLKWETSLLKQKTPAWKALDALQGAILSLSRNQNKKLILQRLFLNI
jgi:DNA polymerase-3 subunit delta'